MKISEILKWLNEQKKEYIFIGNSEEEVTGFSSLKNYRTGSLTWINKTQVYDESRPVPISISCAIVQAGVETEIKNRIVTKQSKELFFRILERFWGNSQKKVKIGSGTFLSEKVKLGKNVFIGHNCVLDGEITISDETRIENQVVIVNHVTIGKRCHIQSEAVIGEDGFGYYEDSDGKKQMIAHFGGVQIGDDVFIGSHVNIARGTIDDTIIENGVKIAPSTHIGHNNRIGENAAVICSNLFGSVETGANAYIVASTIKNQCKVGVNALVGMGSIVTGNVEENKVVVGIPAKPIRENLKAQIHQKHGEIQK